MAHSNLNWSNIPHEDLFKYIGFELMGIREKLGFTQAEVAEKCGLNRMTISQIERGKQKVSLDTLLRLLRTYNMLDRLGDLLVMPEKNPMDKLLDNDN